MTNLGLAHDQIKPANAHLKPATMLQKLVDQHMTFLFLTGKLSVDTQYTTYCNNSQASEKIDLTLLKYMNN